MSASLTRRDALRLGGAAAASVVLAPANRDTAAPWKPIPVGTQLWCVRLQLAKDIPGTLKAVGALGFHHRLSELQGDKLGASVEFNQTIGNRNLIIRSLAPAVYTSADLLKKTADEVNQVAASLKAHKMRVGYHNHTTDFNRIDGEYWWNRFADQTSKDVILQFDTGNSSEAEGVTPQSFIKRNAGRTISMHVKPFSKKDPTAYLAAVKLDWPTIMTAAETF